MRLINTESLKLEEFEGEDIPFYAILSHRWQEEEVLYKDMINGIAHTKKGYQKIVKLCQLAREDCLRYAWCDTCCIDKSSSAELSEAINSMFKWYKSAEVCYAYLFDVQHSNDRYISDPVSNLSFPPSLHIQREFLKKFYNSQLFRRSWTLQELIAPVFLHLYNRSWTKVGDRDFLSATVTYATGIPGSLWDHTEYEPRSFSIAQKMSWAASRIATRTEVMAYSLLGIFGVNIPLLYGEGKAAFRRLQEEILKHTEDDSFLLFADTTMGILAETP